MLTQRWEFWALVIVICLGILSTSEPEESLIDFGNIKEEISEKISSAFSEDEKPSLPDSKSSDSSKTEEGLVDRFLNFLESTENNGKISKNSKFGNFLTERGELSRAVKDFKSSYGSSLVVYRSFVIYPEHLSFDRRDPKKPENIDRFSWHINTGWRGPEPQKTPNQQELNRYLIDLTEVNFDFLPGLVQRALAEAQKTGIPDGKIKYVIFLRRNVQDSKREPMIQIVVEGARQEMTIRADKNGKIYEAKKNK